MIFNELQPASYKGVTFLVSKATTGVGRKQAEYQYPFSNKQKIEDLGLKQRSYTLTCVINGVGNEYFQKRDSFYSVIEDGQKGDLIHPMYGLLQNMVARPISVIEDLSQAGVITVDVTFDRTDDKTQPTPLSNTLSLVNTLNTNVMDIAQAGLTNAFGVKFSQNVFGAIQTVKDFAHTTNTIMGGFVSATSQVNSFNSQLTDMLANPAKYALNSLGFSSAVFDTLNGIFGIIPTPKDQSRAFKKYYTYGDKYTKVPETTPARAEFNQNQQSLRVAIQTGALANAQLAATLQTYESVPEIDQANLDLETQFNKVIQYDLSAEILSELGNLRAIVNNYLEQQKLTASQVIGIYTPQIPAAALSYQYYGTTDRIDEIVSLNNSPDISFIDGDVSVLSK